MTICNTTGAQDWLPCDSVFGLRQMDHGWLRSQRSCPPVFGPQHGNQVIFAVREGINRPRRALAQATRSAIVQTRHWHKPTAGPRCQIISTSGRPQPLTKRDIHPSLALFSHTCIPGRPSVRVQPPVASLSYEPLLPRNNYCVNSPWPVIKTINPPHFGVSISKLTSVASLDPPSLLF